MAAELILSTTLRYNEQDMALDRLHQHTNLRDLMGRFCPINSSDISVVVSNHATLKPIRFRLKLEAEAIVT